MKPIDNNEEALKLNDDENKMFKAPKCRCGKDATGLVNTEFTGYPLDLDVDDEDDIVDYDNPNTTTFAQEYCCDECSPITLIYLQKFEKLAVL